MHQVTTMTGTKSGRDSHNAAAILGTGGGKGFGVLGQRQTRRTTNDRGFGGTIETGLDGTVPGESVGQMLARQTATGGHGGDSGGDTQLLC